MPFLVMTFKCRRDRTLMNTLCGWGPYVGQAGRLRPDLKLQRLRWFNSQSLLGGEWGWVPRQIYSSGGDGVGPEWVFRETVWRCRREKKYGASPNTWSMPLTHLCRPSDQSDTSRQFVWLFTSSHSSHIASQVATHRHRWRTGSDALSQYSGFRGA